MIAFGEYRHGSRRKPRTTATGVPAR